MFKKFFLTLEFILVMSSFGLTQNINLICSKDEDLSRIRKIKSSISSLKEAIRGNNGLDSLKNSYYKIMISLPSSDQLINEIKTLSVNYKDTIRSILSVSSLIENIDNIDEKMLYTFETYLGIINKRIDDYEENSEKLIMDIQNNQIILAEYKSFNEDLDQLGKIINQYKQILLSENIDNQMQLDKLSLADKINRLPYESSQKYSTINRKYIDDLINALKDIDNIDIQNINTIITNIREIISAYSQKIEALQTREEEYNSDKLKEISAKLQEINSKIKEYNKINNESNNIYSKIKQKEIALQADLRILIDSLDKSIFPRDIYRFKLDQYQDKTLDYQDIYDNILLKMNDIAIQQEEIYNSTRFAIPLGVDMELKNNKFEIDSNVTALLGAQFFKPDKYYISAVVRMASNNEVTGNANSFGLFLANPAVAGTSFIISGNKLWPFEVFGWNILVGPAGRFGITKTSWQATITNEATGTSTDQEYDGYLAFLDLGLLLSSKTHTSDDGQEYQIGLEVDLIHRSIIGDLGSDLEEIVNFRSNDAVLSSARTSWGLPNNLYFEFTFFVRINSICPYVRVSWLPGEAGSTDDPYIKNFSDWQAYFGVRLQTPAFNAKSE